MIGKEFKLRMKQTFGGRKFEVYKFKNFESHFRKQSNRKYLIYSSFVHHYHHIFHHLIPSIIMSLNGDKLIKTIAYFVFGSLSVYFFISSLLERANNSKRKKIGDKSDGTIPRSPKTPKFHPKDLYESLTELSNASILINHLGNCHCGQIKFIAEAPSEVHCTSHCYSNVRYPSFSIPVSQFHLLSGADFLVNYSVLLPSSHEIVTSGFCSQCGTYVIHCISSEFGETSPPSAICLNLDCLDRSKFEKVNILSKPSTLSTPLPNPPSLQQDSSSSSLNHQGQDMSYFPSQQQQQQQVVSQPTFISPPRSSTPSTLMTMRYSPSSSFGQTTHSSSTTTNTSGGHHHNYTTNPSLSTSHFSSLSPSPLSLPYEEEVDGVGEEGLMSLYSSSDPSSSSSTTSVGLKAKEKVDQFRFGNYFLFDVVLSFDWLVC